MASRIWIPGVEADGARRRVMRGGLALALAAMSRGAWPLSVKTRAIFGDDGYPPVVYLQQGRPQGFLVDVLRRSEAHLHDRFDIQLMPWKRAYVLALRGQGGLIGVSRNQERETLFDFSRPVYNDDIRVVVLKGKAFPFRDLKDLQGRRIGGVSGASYGEQVDAAIRDGVILVDRDIGQVSRLRKLLAGHLDAAFIGNGELGLGWLMSSNAELRLHRDEFELLPKPLTSDPLHLAFLKSMQEREFLDAFDRATKELGLQV
ncbi:substrate-binding periplasmic protein [Roseateles sp. BYS78W]|uniref:Substrate-binding periplasmic protein n=1 Tax=Pelomonas candidula TaxID=3299025 RepID=A0ABW7HJY0_9BURK